jgi:hypothetical protein
MARAASMKSSYSTVIWANERWAQSLARAGNRAELSILTIPLSNVDCTVHCLLGGGESKTREGGEEEEGAEEEDRIEGGGGALL